MIFSVVQDFAGMLESMPREHPRHRILKLLDQAVRRDVHFIDRHPTTLFQCLWNTCWWYDCPEAAKHYDPPEEGWPAEGPPWTAPGPKLSDLLEAWRAAREWSSPGFRWVRCLRPPLFQLTGGSQVICRGHRDAVRAVSFSADGRCVVSGSQDDTIRTWHASTGKELACFQGHKHYVTTVALSPDGRSVLSASDDQTVRIWDVQTRTTLVRHASDEDNTLHGYFGSDRREMVSWAVAFSPDCRRVVDGSLSGVVRVRDVNTGAELGRFLGHRDEVRAVAFARDGRFIASGGGSIYGNKDYAIRVWEMSRLDPVAYLAGHEKNATTLAFSPDGQWVVSGSDDSTIRLWDVRKGTEVMRFPGHSGGVNCVAFSGDGSQIVSGGGMFDVAIRIWDVTSGEQVACLKGHENYLTAVAFSPDDRQIVSSAGDGTVRLWTLPGVQPGRLRNHKSSIRWCFAFSPDGKRVASGSDDATIRIWDVSSGTQIACLRGHERSVRSVEFSPDMRRLVSGSSDRTVRVWDAQSGEMLVCCIGHEHRVIDVSFSADGRRIISEDEDEMVGEWDPDSGVCLAMDPKSLSDAEHPKPRHPWKISYENPQDMRLDSSATGETIYASVVVEYFTTAPSGQTWAGSAYNHLHLFTLEGGALPID